MDPQQTPLEATPQQTQQTPQQPDESTRHWQSQYDRAQQENAQLRQQLAQQQAQQKPTTPTPDNGPDLNFLDIASMRGENGQMKPEYEKAIFNDKVPKEARQEYWNTITQAQQILTNQTQQSVHEVFGGMDQFQSASEWASTTLPAWEQQALDAALKNPFTAPDALRSLKNKAEAAGVDFSGKQAQPQQPQSGEPSPMPTGGQATAGNLTPLVPGSPQAIAATNKPEYRTDPAYQKQVSERLRMGTSQLPNLGNFLR